MSEHAGRNRTPARSEALLVYLQALVMGSAAVASLGALSLLADGPDKLVPTLLVGVPFAFIAGLFAAPGLAMIVVATIAARLVTSRRSPLTVHTVGLLVGAVIGLAYQRLAQSADYPIGLFDLWLIGPIYGFAAAFCTLRTLDA